MDYIRKCLSVNVITLIKTVYLLDFLFYEAQFLMKQIKEDKFQECQLFRLEELLGGA